MGKTNILITGRPGIGKTTIIRQIVERLSFSVGGFYTEELREKDKRVGFIVRDLSGRVGILAHTKIKTDRKVSKYYVSVKEFEKIAIPALEAALREKEYIIIDEIGPMEEFSLAFKLLVIKCLDSDKRVIATVKQKGSDFVERIKRRADVKLFCVTQENRNKIVLDILQYLE